MMLVCVLFWPKPKRVAVGLFSLQKAGFFSKKHSDSPHWYWLADGGQESFKHL